MEHSGLAGGICRDNSGLQGPGAGSFAAIRARDAREPRPARYFAVSGPASEIQRCRWSKSNFQLDLTPHLALAELTGRNCRRISRPQALRAEFVAAFRGRRIYLAHLST